MSDFKKFCIDEKLSPVQIVGARKAWQEQQTIIDNLKAQLNNMEACYIERKKQVEDQYKKVDELQKENAALVHVIKSRDIQLENEKHEYDELVNKLVDSKMKNTKLQKRVDAALEITKQGIRKQGGDYYLGKLEQALKGGDEWVMLIAL